MVNRGRWQRKVGQALKRDSTGRLDPRLPYGRPKIGRASSTMMPDLLGEGRARSCRAAPRRPPAGAAPPRGSNRPGRGPRAPSASASSCAGSGARPRWLIAAARPGLGRRGEEDLEVGIGKDHRADVPAIHHHVPPRAHHGPEPGVDPLPDDRHGRHRRHGAGDLGRPDLGVDRLALEVGREPGPVGLEHEPAVFGGAEDGLGVEHRQRVAVRPGRGGPPPAAPRASPRDTARPSRDGRIRSPRPRPGPCWTCPRPTVRRWR